MRALQPPPSLPPSFLCGTHTTAHSHTLILPPPHTQTQAETTKERTRQRRGGQGKAAAVTESSFQRSPPRFSSCNCVVFLRFLASHPPTSPKSAFCVECMLLVATRHISRSSSSSSSSRASCLLLLVVGFRVGFALLLLAGVLEVMMRTNETFLYQHWPPLPFTHTVHNDDN